MSYIEYSEYTKVPCLEAISSAEFEIAQISVILSWICKVWFANAGFSPTSATQGRLNFTSSPPSLKLWLVVYFQEVN